MTITAQQIEHVLAILGAAGAVASALGAVLPSQWRLTQALARFGSDIRGIRQPPVGKP